MCVWPVGRCDARQAAWVVVRVGGRWQAGCCGAWRCEGRVGTGGVGGAGKEMGLLLPAAFMHRQHPCTPAVRKVGILHPTCGRVHLLGQAGRHARQVEGQGLTICHDLQYANSDPGSGSGAVEVSWAAAAHHMCNIQAHKGCGKLQSMLCDCRAPHMTRTHACTHTHARACARPHTHTHTHASTRTCMSSRSSPSAPSRSALLPPPPPPAAISASEAARHACTR